MAVQIRSPGLVIKGVVGVVAEESIRAPAPGLVSVAQAPVLAGSTARKHKSQVLTALTCSALTNIVLKLVKNRGKLAWSTTSRPLLRSCSTEMKRCSHCADLRSLRREGATAPAPMWRMRYATSRSAPLRW